MDDCLRCHGMRFEGGIGDLVTPADRQGPWHLKDVTLAASPSMPCITCHEMHREGTPASSKGDRDARPSLALYDRRTQQYVPLAELPLPAMWDGGRPVKVSPDRRQALCYQCHAPLLHRPGGQRRRPHRDGSSRRHRLPRLPSAARAERQSVVRQLPPEDVELRARRREDGYQLRLEDESAQRPTG